MNHIKGRTNTFRHDLGFTVTPTLPPPDRGGVSEMLLWHRTQRKRTLGGLGLWDSLCLKEQSLLLSHLDTAGEGGGGLAHEFEAVNTVWMVLSNWFVSFAHHWRVIRMNCCRIIESLGGKRVPHLAISLLLRAFLELSKYEKFKSPKLG